MTTDPTSLSASQRYAPRGSRQLADAARAFGHVITVKQDEVVSARAPTLEYVCFIESGFTASKRTLHDGRQQTVALSVPGDIIDHEALTVGEVFSTTYALTDTCLLQVAATRFAQLLQSDFEHQKLFTRFIAYQGVLAREWLIRSGRLNATQKTAHLVCELFWRMRAAGRTQDDFCTLALRQGEWADILGLSLVQQNRSLAALREKGLVDWSNRGFRIRDRARLEQIACFDKAYLAASVREADGRT